MNQTRLCLTVMLLATLTICVTAQTPKIKYVPTRFVNPADASALYQQNCVSCHGPQLDGRGPAALALDPPPTNLTMIAKTNGGQFPYLHVQETIAGREYQYANPNKAHMPEWHSVMAETYSHDEVKVRLAVYNLTKLLASHQK